MLAKNLALVFIACLLAFSATATAQEGGPFTCPPCTEGGGGPANPEPATMSLLALGGLGLVYSRRRRKDEKAELLARD